MARDEGPGAAERASERERFLAVLPLLRELVAFIARRHGLSPEQQEELESRVRLRVLEDDCAILRQWREEAALSTYLRVVVHRIFHDYCNEEWGRWRQSAMARRLGPVAVDLEEQLYREGLTFLEASQVVMLRHPVTQADLEALYTQLPPRPGRPRAQGSPGDEIAETAATFDPEQAAILQADALAVDRAIGQSLRKMPATDRLLLQLHFEEGLNLAQISRTLGTPQRVLYRRLRKVLNVLRRALKDEGLEHADVERLLQRKVDLDFDLEPERENPASRQSTEGDGQPRKV
jgi:RNA polymerase sigma factor (sigma-70 family)